MTDPRVDARLRGVLDAARARSALLASLAVVATATPAARADYASGAHGRIEVSTGTRATSAPTSLTYAARLHAARDPEREPPALRDLRIRLPAGMRIDTSLLPRCTASELTLRLLGERACPSAAKVGTGIATVRQVGLGVATFPTAIYNAPGDLLELILLGDRVVGVAHTYVRGRTLDGPIPTCITGGQPPRGCPFDQVILLANRLTVRRISVGDRAYVRTPETCPRSRRWDFPTTLRFADGSLDRVVPRSRCARRARPPGFTG